jgi:CheY-like chemotaxis protein
LDGISATIEIRNRESESTAKTPIFALVGSASQADGEYLAADFDQCLIKPVSRDNLLQAIATLNIPDKEIAN